MPARTLTLGPGLTRADIPSLCAGLAASLRGRAGGGTVTCDVASVCRPDVVTVEALARLRQAALPFGWSFEICGASPELLGLLHLLGLSDVLNGGQ